MAIQIKTIESVLDVKELPEEIQQRIKRIGDVSVIAWAKMIDVSRFDMWDATRLLEHPVAAPHWAQKRNPWRKAHDWVGGYWIFYIPSKLAEEESR